MQQLIQYGTTRLQAANDAEHLVGVHVRLVLQSVCTEKLIADLEPGHFRHLGADHHLKTCFKCAAFRQPSAVVLGVGIRAAHDAVAAVVVPISQRNPLRDVRMADDLFRIGEPNVPGRRVDVVDIGQNQLQWTAFGAEHQIDVFNVAVKRITQLLFGQHEQTDHAYPKGEKHQAQGRLQFLEPDVAPRDVQPVKFHADWG